MSAPTDPQAPPSLLRSTIRRSATTGRVYLVVSSVLAFLYSAIFAVAGGATFDTEVPLLLPVLVVVGGLGALVVFTNDRIKGVLEYLVAYGVSPRRIFLNFLLASLALVSVVVVVAVTGGLAIHVASGGTISESLALAVGLYAVPMSYATTAFAVTVGMYWTSLSSPRSGMNSPIGLAPLIGVAPPLVTLLVATTLNAVAPAYVVPVVVAALVLVIVLVVLLLSMIERLMPRERLLSPA